MKYMPSVNIEQSVFDPQSYITTPNALRVVGDIVNSFYAGIHSFNIIGSYGTGKSSFILALEHSLSLKENSHILIPNNNPFHGFKSFQFYKFVGDYTSLGSLLKNGLPSKYKTDNLFERLKLLLSEAEKKGELVFIVIDEFGKLLEYAAKNNLEKELYLFQKFAEFLNDHKHNVILLTMLHQNFNSYANGFSDSQRQEWNKVKGRFKEIVFNEPVEQLLYLAGMRMEKSLQVRKNKSFEELYNLALNTRFASKSIVFETAEKLYPMDLFAAQSLTLSIQRYGQNERSLFSFLEITGKELLQSFEGDQNTTYSLADIYDYDVYNFYSYLSEVNADSASWTGIKVALERVESLFDSNIVVDAAKLVKAIGMINLFGNAGVRCDKKDLTFYAQHALGIAHPQLIIDLLDQYKIIRYAEYKSQYMLFEGTDVNIEGELLAASGIVPRSSDIIDKLCENFSFPVEFANAAYFRKGTPRYFEYVISERPIHCQPQNEIDGYVNLIFNETISLDQVKTESANEDEAILYAYFKHSDRIIDHVWMLDKLAYVQHIVDSFDKVAQREIKSLMIYERDLLNAEVLNVLYNYSAEVVWVYRGNEITIDSKTTFNRWLSRICDEVYEATPIILNEMVNKHKPSGAMSTARVNLLSHVLEYSADPNLGFDEDRFPPEKTIYRTLLKNTGIHREYLGQYELGEPQDASFAELWNTCEAFLDSTKEKPRKLGELINALKVRPFKLKQGVIDLWIPIYLIIRKNEYSLYSDKGVFIPNINREVLDILQKAPSNYQVKAFNMDGVKLDLYNKYREALSLSQDDEFTASSLVETIKPFLLFYKRLSAYAKQTKRLKKTTLQFRSVLAYAKDPEKTFFEDLPRALGFKGTDLSHDNEVLKSYVGLLQDAIRDLRSCYANLISRLERAVVEALNLRSSDFGKYKVEIEEKYAQVKTYLLTDKQKAMLARIVAKSVDKITWYQSLAYLVLDKPLEQLLDEEENYLVDNLVHVFKELDKFVEISGFNKEDDFFRFELISNDGMMTPQIVHLNDAKTKKAAKLESRIDALLSGDDDVDAYALLSILKRRLRHE